MARRPHLHLAPPRLGPQIPSRGFEEGMEGSEDAISKPLVRHSEDASEDVYKKIKIIE